MSKLIQKIKYYFWASYRRKFLDKLQKKYSNLYKGKVLDIGGRDRGNFIKPRENTTEWIFVDIEEKNKPDILMDVAKMDHIESNSIDVINAIELFEHVGDIDNGIRECYRVLKPGGICILSAPFLYPIHSDPFDFQRWTEFKWKNVLSNVGFDLCLFEITGGYFTILGDMVRKFVRSLPAVIRHIFYFFYPFFDVLVKLDNINLVKNSENLKGYHGGYFIICHK
ncbi:MAG: methyltransferase domain-containing protein [Candidatus Magasanikbacteria bacterium]